jgi:hypothetical protein
MIPSQNRGAWAHLFMVKHGIVRVRKSVHDQHDLGDDEAAPDD